MVMEGNVSVISLLVESRQPAERFKCGDDVRGIPVIRLMEADLQV